MIVTPAKALGAQRPVPIRRPDDYLLCLTMRASDGLVEVQHQAAPGREAAAKYAARMAAEIVDAVGPVAVAAKLGAPEVGPSDLVPGVVVEAPAKGTAVLMCRCGNAIDSEDMRWSEPPSSSSSLNPLQLRRVVCRWCA